jgi:hypothetical protein
MQDAQWQDLYRSAILEVDPVELRKKVDLAKAAIRERNENLKRGRDSNLVEELGAIADALKNLAVLERSELQMPLASGCNPSAAGEP